jgi:carboxymethylenebutenolidase
VNRSHIDPRIFELYDEYCHGGFGRREFLRRAGAITVGGISGLTMAETLLPRYARAETIAADDGRMEASRVGYPSPGGTSGEMRGYLVAPVGDGPFPAVLVIHENRGLNPYVEDVARRVAVAGFLALAPDGLSPVGGYPGNDDDGRALQRALDPIELGRDMLNGARFLKSHPLSNGRLGAIGFCWGGSMTYRLAILLGEDLRAGVPFYGSPPPAKEVARIRASLLVHSAEDDARVNAGWPELEAALGAAGVSYVRHVYPGTRHGFHNDSTPRYDAPAAALAWERTLAFLRRELA